VNRLKKGKGFTLIELILVLMILGIIAMISMPGFMNRSRKAKMEKAMMVEATDNLDSIYTAQEAYETQNSVYRACEANPGYVENGTDAVWDNSRDGWSDIGFEPTGPILCSYEVTLISGGEGFEITAKDQDGIVLTRTVY